MKQLRLAWQAVIFIVLLSLGPYALAASQLKDIRVWHSPENSRVVLDFSEEPDYKVFFLENPARFVVDTNNASSVVSVPPPSQAGPYLKSFRLGQPKKGVVRLVLDLKQSAQIKSFLLKPAAGFRYRVVLDISAKPGEQGIVAAKPSNSNVATAVKPSASSPPVVRSQTQGPILVAIDAGHGGEDSGAVGLRSREKDIVLSIAKRLKAKIDAQPNMRAFLTRESDYFIPLRKRIKLARTKDKHPADLFVSVHADGFHNPAARGSSVYTLSSKGATSEEARWLANQENAADLAGGVSIGDHDPDVAKTLLDMSMSNTSHESIVLARAILMQLKRIGKVHSRSVERAGFVVLKSPDIPSVLVETAFITNPSEESLLRSSSHQDKLANAVLSGIKDYIGKSPTLAARMRP